MLAESVLTAENAVASALEASEKKDFFQYITSLEFWVTIIVIVVAVGVWLLITKLSKKRIIHIKATETNKQSISQKSTFTHVITSVMRALLLVGAVIVILQVNGVNVSSLVAGLGLASAIIGFALQDAIKDIINGLYIFSDHYFQVGDCIRYEGVVGEVIHMSIRSTKIRSIADNSEMTISNRNFSEATKVSDLFDIDIGLAYEEDVKKVHSVLKSIAEKKATAEGVKKAEYKGTQNFDDSAIIYKLRFFCDPKDSPDIRRRCIKIIQDGLNEAGIVIPYQQLDVHNIPADHC